jgi:hypothetical protein
MVDGSCVITVLLVGRFTEVLPRLEQARPLGAATGTRGGQSLWIGHVSEAYLLAGRTSLPAGPRPGGRIWHAPARSALASRARDVVYHGGDFRISPERVYPTIETVMACMIGRRDNSSRGKALPIMPPSLTRAFSRPARRPLAVGRWGFPRAGSPAASCMGRSRAAPGPTAPGSRS